MRNRYPSEERLIFLSHFRNSTFQPRASQQLTEHIRREMERRSNFILTTDRSKARFWLTGEALLYHKRRRVYTADSQTAHYELIAACRIKLSRNPGFATERDSIPFSREISHRIHYSEGQGYQASHRDNEDRARSRLFRILAIRINQALEKQL